jgi:hypothetical protein
MKRWLIVVATLLALVLAAVVYGAYLWWQATRGISQ